jgi:hypothetical protein
VNCPQCEAPLLNLPTCPACGLASEEVRSKTAASTAIPLAQRVDPSSLVTIAACSTRAEAERVSAHLQAGGVTVYDGVLCGWVSPSTEAIPLLIDPEELPRAQAFLSTLPDPATGGEGESADELFDQLFAGAPIPAVPATPAENSREVPAVAEGTAEESAETESTDELFNQLFAAAPIPAVPATPETVPVEPIAEPVAEPVAEAPADEPLDELFTALFAEASRVLTPGSVPEPSRVAVPSLAPSAPAPVLPPPESPRALESKLSGLMDDRDVPGWTINPAHHPDVLAFIREHSDNALFLKRAKALQENRAHYYETMRSRELAQDQ